MQKLPSREPTLPPDNIAQIDSNLARQLGSNWGWILFRGIAGIVFGVLALLLPWITALTLVALFGAYALVDGIFAIISIFTGRRVGAPWWALLIEGLLGIVAGLLALLLPIEAWITLAGFMGGWLIAGGLVEIFTAVRLMHDIDNEWWLILSGALSIIAGVLLFVRPFAGGVAVVYVLGIYAILFGVMLTAFALRVRKWRPEGPALPLPAHTPGT